MINQENTAHKSQTDEIVIPHISPENFAEMELGYDIDEFVLDPKEMVAIVNAYQQLESIAASEIPAGTDELINWQGLYQHKHFFYDPPYKSSSFKIPSPEEDESDEWETFVKSQYELATGITIDDEAWGITEDQVKELFEFQENPTRAVSEAHPWLKAIPGIVEKAQKIELARQITYAKYKLKYKPICLISRGHMPSDLIPKVNLDDVLRGEWQCWMFLEHESFEVLPDEMEDMSLLKFSAVFIDNQGHGKAALIAVVTGFYVVPFKDKYLMHPDNFMFTMDAHSEYLNHVWKAVIGRFFPRNGFADLNQFYEICGTLGGIAAVSINVHPKYRGRKLSHSLLATISSMTFDETGHDYLTHEHHEHSNGDREISENSISHAPIRLYVIAIEGSKPENDNPFDWLHSSFMVNTPAPPVKVHNFQIERRRLKLTKYFNDIESQAMGFFFIETYNPWDYPIT